MLRVVNAGADGTWKLRERYDAERTTLSRGCRFDPGSRKFCEGNQNRRSSSESDWLERFESDVDMVWRLEGLIVEREVEGTNLGRYTF